MNSKIKNTHNTIQLFAENKALRESGIVDHYRNWKEFGKNHNIPTLVLTLSLLIYKTSLSHFSGDSTGSDFLTDCGLKVIMFLSFVALSLITWTKSTCSF
jgi:hypothetical protein